MGKFYNIGTELNEISYKEVKNNENFTICIVNEAESAQLISELNIKSENEIKLSEIYFCKLDIQQDCLYGTISIPRLLDVIGSRYKIAYIITAKTLIFIENDDFTLRIIRRIQRKKNNQGDTKERFISNFISEFISGDNELLESFERELINAEDIILMDKSDEARIKLQPLRKQLLILRSYYGQITDMVIDLAENENHYFAKKQLKYFRNIADKTERLRDRADYLLEYAKQVIDLHQLKIDSKQNANMQFLTMISTIFFPLTLITGWYGMNFENMPELADGYPFVIIAAIIVVIICIIIKKKKKIL